MKLQAPENCSGASFNGSPVEMDENGIAEVSNNPDLTAALQAHGFTAVAEEAQPKPWAKGRKAQ